MSQYKNSPTDFNILRKRIIVRAVPVILLGLIAGFAISYFRSSGDHTDPVIWLIMIGIIVAIFSYSIFRGIKRQKEIYDTYTLTIGVDFITREQNGLSPVTLRFVDIKKINTDKYGNLFLKGETSAQQICVSAFLENYDDVKNLLETVQPITEPKSYKFFQKYPFLLPLITVGLMAAVYLSNNKLVVAISGSFLIGVLIWSFYKIRTSAAIDNRIKQKSLWVFVVVISVGIILYYKLFIN